MAGLLPNAKQQFFDDNGDPLENGLVYFYVPGTTEPKDTWQNPEGTILNSNPVELDSAGRAVIFGVGSYRQIVKDQLGNTIWDQITSPSIDGVTALVDIVADLRAYNTSSLLEGQLVYVQGYSEVDDDGGGFFKATQTNPGADNDIEWIHSTTTGWYYVRILPTGTNGAFFRIEMAGAKKDNTTDCAAAFANTLEVALGREVRLMRTGAGAYKITGNIPVDPLVCKAINLTSDCWADGLYNGVHNPANMSRVEVVPDATDTKIFDFYSTEAPLTASIGPFIVRGIHWEVSGANADGTVLIGFGDPSNHGGDGSGQRYCGTLVLEGNNFRATGFSANTSNTTITRTNTVAVYMTKVFQAQITQNTFDGFDIQVRAYGCDHPNIYRNRFTAGFIPVYLEAFGSFSVDHVLDQNQIEGWIACAVYNNGVMMHCDGRFENNNGGPGKDDAPCDLTAEDGTTVNVVAGTNTFVFSASMTTKLIENVSVCQFSRAWEVNAIDSFAGGAGYAVGDINTYTNGVQVEVTGINAGAITTFVIRYRGEATISSAAPTGAMAQTATTGGGAASTITPSWRQKDVFYGLVTGISGVNVTFQLSTAGDSPAYGGEMTIAPWSLAAARVTRIHGAAVLVGGSMDSHISGIGGPHSNSPWLIWFGGRGKIMCDNILTSGEGDNETEPSILIPNQGQATAQFQMSGVRFRNCSPAVIGDPGHPFVTVYDANPQGNGSNSSGLPIQAGNERKLTPPGFFAGSARRRWFISPQTYSQTDNSVSRMVRKRIESFYGGAGTEWGLMFDAAGDVIPAVQLANQYNIIQNDLPGSGYFRARFKCTPISISGTPTPRLWSFNEGQAGVTLLNNALTAGLGPQTQEYIGAATWSPSATRCGFLITGTGFFFNSLEVEELTEAEYFELLRPSFLAIKSAGTANQTGNGANYTLICDTEVRDIGSWYNNATGLATAPTDGTYIFKAAVRVSDYTALMTYSIITLITNSGNFPIGRQWTPIAGQVETLFTTEILNLSAGDDVSVDIEVNNGAGDTADIDGGAGPVPYITWFSGELLKAR